MSDNVGGGACREYTYFLDRIVEKDFRNATIGFFWDPMAVRISAAAGEGATLRLRIGGKCSELSGQPIDIDVKVMRIRDTAVMPFTGKTSFPLGCAVWLRHAPALLPKSGEDRTSPFPGRI